MFDTSSWPLQAQGTARVIAMQVSHDAARILFAATDTADVAVLDAFTGRPRHIEKHLGNPPGMLLNP